MEVVQILLNFLLFTNTCPGKHVAPLYIDAFKFPSVNI